VDTRPFEADQSAISPFVGGLESKESNQNRLREALLLTYSQSLSVTVNVESKQIWKNSGEHTNLEKGWRAKTESLPERCVCVNCHLNSGQVFRLLCLK